MLRPRSGAGWLYGLRPVNTERAEARGHGEDFEVGLRTASSTGEGQEMIGLSCWSSRRARRFPACILAKTDCGVARYSGRRSHIGLCQTCACVASAFRRRTRTRRSAPLPSRTPPNLDWHNGIRRNVTEMCVTQFLKSSVPSCLRVLRVNRPEARGRPAAPRAEAARVHRVPRVCVDAMNCVLPAARGTGMGLINEVYVDENE